jgi:hypothetical protein
MKRRRASAFPMVDTDTGEQISCKISFACLLPAPGQAKDVLAEFEAKRENIEDIASRKFDAGERPPIITTRET